MKNSIKKKFLSMKTVLAGLVVLAAAPAAMALGGGAPNLVGGYVGLMPAEWFEDVPCNTESVTVLQEQYYEEWQIDATAVANDGDPNTFVHCILKANEQDNVCMAGRADGTVIACRDDSGPHLLPSDGDIVYIQIDTFDLNFCNVFIGTGDRFGEANPACRESGGGSGGGASTGGTSGGGGLGCVAGNSTPVVKAAVTPFNAGQCYSYNKTQGTLKFGNWSQTTSFGIDLEDSANNAISTTVGSGSYFNIVGVADGTVYFKVDKTFSGQVDSW